MTLSLPLALWLLVLHYVGDFLVQTESQALAKHHDNLALTRHVMGYWWTLWFGLLVYFGIVHWDVLTVAHVAWFALPNLALHWTTDYITSRQVARLWARPSKRAAFKVIGLDQLLHVSTLLLTAYWLLTP